MIRHAFSGRSGRAHRQSRRATPKARLTFKERSDAASVVLEISQLVRVIGRSSEPAADRDVSLIFLANLLDDAGGYLVSTQEESAHG